MNESQFVEKNKADWKKLESTIANEDRNPEVLHELFMKVSGDLAYAQTYFPRRSVRMYLNTLVNSVFDLMRTRKKQNLLGSILHYYNHTLPSEIIRNKNAFFVSVLSFTLAVLIGIFSTMKNDKFPITIMGREYMNITENNINSGDPMAIYKSGTRTGSFLAITTNNIKVAFLAFVFGIFASIGSIFILIRNGIMLGAFQCYFYQKGLFITSFFTIWIHGTIEISSIIVAGAAGLVLGNSILFPGTFTRMQSLQIGAIRALFILISTIPLFMLAGTLEGFVTPITNLPAEIKLFIIISSAIFISFIYIVKPYQYAKKLKEEGTIEDNLNTYIKENNDSWQDQITSTLQSSFFAYRSKFGKLFSGFILPAIICMIVVIYGLTDINSDALIKDYGNLTFFNYKFGGIYLFLATYFIYIYFFAFMHCLQDDIDFTFVQVINTIKSHFLALTISSLIAILPYYLLPPQYSFVAVFILPFSISIILNENMNDDESDSKNFGKALLLSYKWWVDILGINIGIIGIMFILNLLSSTIGNQLLGEILAWHDIFSDFRLESFFINSLLDNVFELFLLPLIYLLFKYRFYIIMNESYSYDIAEKIHMFGSKNEVE